MNGGCRGRKRECESAVVNEMKRNAPFWFSGRVLRLDGQCPSTIDLSRPKTATGGLTITSCLRTTCVRERR